MNFVSHFFLASCHALMERPDDARTHLRRALETAPRARFSDIRKLPFKDPTGDRRYREGLRKAGLPE